MDDFVVVQTHPNLIAYIDMLQKKNAEALSFYPKQVFEREQEKGRLFLGMLNGEPCGYLYVGATGRDVKCHQVCIEYDARRRLYGAQLVSVMEHYAQEGRSSSITLRCGFDLDANQFWKDLGYSVIMHQAGGVRRMRTINIWRKQLTPELFENIALEPAVGKTNPTIWKRNKSTGVVSQFSRGNKLSEYRALIVERDSRGIV